MQYWQESGDLSKWFLDSHLGESDLPVGLTLDPKTDSVGVCLGAGIEDVTTCPAVEFIEVMEEAVAWPLG